MDCDFSPSSPHLLPNGLFSPQNRISFELLALSGLSGFSTFKGGKMLIFQGFANSRIVREFPPFSFKVRIATLTRNQFDGDITWVRIPPAAPERRERLLPALFVAAARAYRLKPSSAPSRARPGGLSETRPEADKQAAPARSDALCRSLFALARLSYAFFDAKNLCFQSQHLYCQKLGLPFVGIHQFMPLRTNWRKLLTAGGV